MEKEIVGKELEFRKVFAQRLRSLRKERDLTYKELAAAMNKTFDISISYASIANYERNTRIPSIQLLSQFATFFDVSSDFLLGNSDIKNANVIQTTVFDSENNPHIVKVGIDKDSDLANRPFSEIIELVEKLKELGFTLERRSSK